ncbi:hypothetical protein LDL76_12590 [Salegentibacter mishustinae]|uniref:hypothetical protein n=1 Tax=Salegentibacter mishustinae TaxID=270918 RepID=UPI001CE125F9|nr:hypothetical protein [Salegentibacter mishustinae]UBZ06193.1 hypothetical protein LDL76_12590 [Salegentibacter mishustinae]
MNELIEQALDKYFSDFKEYHLIILILFTVIIALMQIIQSILVSRKIERFKNELKKSEIRFSRHNQLQVEALSNIYPILVETHLHTLVLQTEIQKDVNERDSLIIKNWQDSFNEIFNEYTKNAYIIPNEIKNEFSKFIQSLIKVNSYLKIEKELKEMYVEIQGNDHFFGEEEKRIELTKDLDDLKEEKTLDRVIDNVTNLKTEIEEYFLKID